MKDNFLECNFCKNSIPKLLFIKNDFNIVKCPFCDLVYVSNPPSKTGLKRLYSFEAKYHKILEDTVQSTVQPTVQPKLYHKIARFFLTKRHLNFARKNYIILKKYKKQGKILDIGCSIGLFLKIAKENDWETYGLEISEDSAKIAKNKYDLNISTGTLNKKLFEPNFFDAVTMWEVIEHIPNPMNTLAIINKITKDKGILIISTPNIDGLFPKITYKLSKLLNCWPHPEPPHHLFQFSKSTLTNMLDANGFKVLKIIDKRIWITYTFQNELKNFMKSPQKAAYALIFSPFILLGEFLKSGDRIIAIAEKSNSG